MKLAILASLVPGAGSQSSARGPFEGSAKSDFGALLGGLAKDTPAGATPALVAGVPPTVAPTGSASASFADALVPGNGEEGETGSRQKASSPEGELQLSAVSVAAASPAAGVSVAPSVTSLLTLATRAAEPTRSGATAALGASDLASVPTVAPGAKRPRSAVPADDGDQESDRVVQKTSKPDDDDDRNDGGAATVTCTPTAVAGPIVATIGPDPATVPLAADTTQPNSATDAPMAARPLTPEAGSQSITSSTAVTPPTVDDASGSSPTLPTIVAPPISAGEIGIAPIPPAAASPVDAAILPDTVRVESHLGFDRGVLVAGTQTQLGATIGAAKVRAGDSSRSEDRPIVDVPVAPLDPPMADAGVDAAASGSPHPTGGRKNSSSGGVEASFTLQTAAPGANGVTALSSGAAPSSPANATAKASSAGAKRAAAPLSPQLARVGADGDAAGSTPSRQASTGAAVTDSAPRPAAPSTKPLADEPNPPAADPTSSMPAALITASTLPTPQAALPVAQQVADGVASLAATVVPDETSPGTPVQPARTMALQLSPAGLGTVTVRLHVAGRALDVHLEASDERTVALIDRDRDVLSSALRGKDYQLQTLSVTTHDATMPGGTHAERGTEPRLADTGSTDMGGGPSGGRSRDGGSRDAPDRTARPSSRPADENTSERGGSSLFV